MTKRGERRYMRRRNEIRQQEKGRRTRVVREKQVDKAKGVRS